MDAQANRRAKLIEVMDDNHCWPTFSNRPSPKFCDYDDSYAEMAGEYLGIEWGDTRQIMVPEKQGTPETDVPKYAATIYDETYHMIGLFDSLTEALAYSNGQNGEEYLTGGGDVIDLDVEPGVSGAIAHRTVVLTVPAFEAACELITRARLEGWTPGASDIDIELDDAFPWIDEDDDDRQG